MLPNQARPSAMTARSGSSGVKSPIPFARIMTPVEWKNLHFIIMDCPTSNTLPFYAQQLSELGVSDVVRVCEPTYDKEYLGARGITVHDWAFADGTVPPTSVVQQFLALCDDRFDGLCQGGSPTNKSIIAVHCVAGLGRAPVLVAAALVEAGMAPLDTIEFIRKRRRGALNSVQLTWLVDNYKRQFKKGKPTFTIPHPSSSSSQGGNGSGDGSSKSTLRESFGRMFKLSKTKSTSSESTVA